MTLTAPSAPVPTDSLRTRALAFLPLFAGGYALAYTKLPLHLPTTCGFKLTTGLPCPFCNMTHAFCAIATGHLKDAANFHAGSIPLATLTLASALLLTGELLLNKPLLAPFWKKNYHPLLWATTGAITMGWTLNILHVLHRA